jgi:hypothetical protein
MRRLFVLMLCAWAISIALAQGGEKKSAPVASDNLKVVEMSVSPAQAPRPALKWRLMPELLEQTPLDAVPLYLKAMLLMENKDGKFWDLIVKWLDTAPAKLPRDEVRAKLNEVEGTLHYVEMGSRRSLCNWAVPLREEEAIMQLMLPEIQKARSLGRLVALRARLEIAEGKHAEALGTLKTGYALAKHVGEQPLLISGLVGIAIANQMNGQLEALIRSPGAPGLYWAIAALPEPLVDMREAWEAEANWIHLYFRKTYEARRAGKASPEQWQIAFDELITKMRTLADLEGNPQAVSEASKLWETALKGMVSASATSSGKQDLIARGRPEKEVQAMTPAQVAVLDFFETYEDYRDELFKWFCVPYVQARQGIARAEQPLTRSNADKTEMAKRPGTLLASLMLPAVGKCHLKEAILRRDIAALRCIEAVRLYAGAHQGKLPSRLEEIADLPIPTNPVTGAAFAYRVEGGVGVLLADGPDDTKRTEYRIKIARP